MSPQFNSKHSSIQKAPKLLLLKSNYINQCYVNCIDWSIAYPPTQFCFVSNGTYKELFGLFHSFAQRGWELIYFSFVHSHLSEMYSFHMKRKWSWRRRLFCCDRVNWREPKVLLEQKDKGGQFPSHASEGTLQLLHFHHRHQPESHHFQKGWGYQCKHSPLSFYLYGQHFWGNSSDCHIFILESFSGTEKSS